MVSCLIIDDNDTNRQMVSQVAISCGMEALEATDGLSALLLCQEKMPDMVVMDWMMPEINGIEFLMLLRNMQDGDKPHVIMCSAKSNNNVLNMSKPYFPNSLRDSMVRAMLS